MDDKEINQKASQFVKWALGIIGSLIVAALYGGFKFYTEWVADEAAEEQVDYQSKALMFDSPSQKEEHKDHVDEAMTGFEQQKKVMEDKAFQERVLNQLKMMSHIDTLNADQMFQIKEKLEKLDH